MKAQWIQGSFSGRFSEAELHSSSNPGILTLNKIVSFSFVLSLSIYIYTYVCLCVCVSMSMFLMIYYRRKFRSQTSDNMDR